jgi:serine-type D-Ala-D-Ala carboxypeptidase/endopeptidase (penicillin-binding protein 4)
MPDTTIRARAAAVGRSVRRSVRRVPTAFRQRWRNTPPHRRQTWRLSVTAAVAGLVVAFTAIVVAGPWDSGQRTAERARAGTGQGDSGANHIPEAPGAPEPAPSAPEVLRALGVTPGTATGGGDDAPPPAPTPTALAEALEPLLKDPALGPVVSASVVDAVTGKQLFGSDADRPATPASTIKLATSVAVLTARGADHRIETPVVRTGSGRIVLAGGGDPTLAKDDLDALAADTARALKESGEGKPTVRVGYDTSLYSGPVLHPIGRNDNLAPVTPLMLDEARLDGSHHRPAPRAADPAKEAAREFAQRLADHGVTVKGEPARATAGDDAEQLAVHRSVTIARLVERMLTHSDNDLAEALARQTALALGKPASFAGAGKAVRGQLDELGLPLKGSRFADGSGLDRSDRLTAELLTELLALAADADHPQLRTVLTGLPVAHFTGTLGGRYDDARGAGVVRAKTGTLTGVNTLAGTVVDAEGRMLAFAFLTTGTKDRYGAQAALDRMASALAACGCR